MSTPISRRNPNECPLHVWITKKQFAQLKNYAFKKRLTTRVVVEKALKAFLRKPKRRKQRVKSARAEAETAISGTITLSEPNATISPYFGQLPRCPAMFGPGVQCTQVVGHSGDHST